MNLLLPLQDRSHEASASSRAMRQFQIETGKARGFGKPLAAALMDGLARVLPLAPSLYETIENWPGDLASDGVAFRLNAGLHALAMEGRAGALARLFGVGEQACLLPQGELDRALIHVLNTQAADLQAWLSHPTQTNEVGRVAGLIAALLDLGRDHPLPCEVLELGASAGLNLNFPRYAVDLGGVATCAASSPVRLAPGWRGRTLERRPLEVLALRGVDLSPRDVRDPADRQRLKAYVWPGESGRRDRLEAAIALAMDHPPQVEAGLASAWLLRQLAVPQEKGVRRVVFHSMVLQYADAAERTAIDSAFQLAAKGAEPDRPLARIAMEWRADRQAVELRIAEWDGATRHGVSRCAAICHPYGEWFHWCEPD